MIDPSPAVGPARHLQVLGCRHPIVAVAMNQVSDLALALACHEAGILPSLSSFNFHVDGRLDRPSFIRTLNEFAQATGTTRLLLSMGLGDLADPALLPAIHGAGFRLIELFKRELDTTAWHTLLQDCARLETQAGLRFFFKLHRREDALHDGVRRIIFKGNEGAGRTDPTAGTLAENVEQLRAARPTLDIVASGGIGSAADVREHLARGVLAVGVGTLFAAAAESCLAPAAKQKMVQASLATLQRFGPLNTQGLLLSKPERDNANQTEALRLGIRHGDQGALFMGKGVAQITGVWPLKDIVASLLEGLDA